MGSFVGLTLECGFCYGPPCYDWRF